MARPNKYEGGLRISSVALPTGLFESIESQSKDRGISKNELIVTILASHDPTELNLIFSKIKELKSLLLVNKKSITEYQTQLDKIINKNTIAGLYSKIKVDDNVEEFISYMKTKRQTYLNTIISKSDAKGLCSKYEDWLYKKKKLKIKNKSTIIAIFKGKMASI